MVNYSLNIFSKSAYKMISGVTEIIFEVFS